MKKLALSGGHSEAPKSFSREDEICIKVCNIIQRMILAECPDSLVCAVVPVVDADGKHLDLMGKVYWANKHDFDCFIDVHVNWSDSNAKAKGYTIFYDDKDTPLAKESKRLAEMVSGKFISKGINPWNGEALATDNMTACGNLAVCSYTNMPAILIELGFLSNKEEAQWLEVTENQERLADCIIGGVKNFFL